MSEPTPSPRRAPRGITPAERFSYYTNKAGPLPPTRPDLGPCWVWEGPIRTRGYGNMADGGISHLAHRWSYAHHVGPIPDGKGLDHLCRVHGCVRPEHLEPTTQRTNVLRGVSPSATHAAKTACPKCGGPYDTEQRNGRPRRFCRPCRNANARARWAENGDGNGQGAGSRQREKTHCPAGHEYTPDNTYHRPDKPASRMCRTCRSAANRRHRSRGA